MKVKDAMTRDVKRCHPEDSVATAARLMWDFDCGSIPIVEREGRVVGMVTDRDVCMAALLNGKALHDIACGRVMSQSIVRCKVEDDLAEALAVMGAARLRRLPVVDGTGALAGILSLTDVAHAAERDRSLFSHVRPRDVARALAAIARPHGAPAQSTMQSSAYAE